MLKGDDAVLIAPETAIKLDRGLGMPVEYWLNLEAAIYQETRARLAAQAKPEKSPRLAETHTRQYHDKDGMAAKT